MKRFISPALVLLLVLPFSTTTYSQTQTQKPLSNPVRP